MVRTYKRKSDRTERSTENVQQLHKAVMAVRKGQSFRQVAEEFGIKKSSLRRAVRKDGEGKKLASYSEMSQSRLIFTIEEEVELVQYLLTASRIGFPLDTATVKSLAYTLAIRNGNRVPDNWEKNKQAGKDWMTAFKSRHRQLSIRTPEATSIARATQHSDGLKPEPSNWISTILRNGHLKISTPYKK
ncbi:hypothetical protein V1264_021226 [Littorina saxatilis]|uniref:HTH CENPB-type domain-containing protein n=1 Tax=Littorina saxatilis TaxID=31220 RepID=A0AAN9FV96_9CAEN